MGNKGIDACSVGSAMHFVSNQVHCVYIKEAFDSSLGALTWVHALRAAAIAAKLNYTDMGIISFLTNVECPEGLLATLAMCSSRI